MVHSLDQAEEVELSTLAGLAALAGLAVLGIERLPESECTVVEFACSCWDQGNTIDFPEIVVVVDSTAAVLKRVDFPELVAEVDSTAVVTDSPEMIDSTEEADSLVALVGIPFSEMDVLVVGTNERCL